MSPRIDRMIIGTPAPDSSKEDLARHDLQLSLRRLSETENALSAILQSIGETRKRGGDWSKLENARRKLEIKLRELKNKKNQCELQARMYTKK